jgi:hypothetical protein
LEDAMIQLGEQDPSTSRKKAPHTNEEDGVFEQDVPRNVGPIMGGLQKQVSEITLDNMFESDVEQQVSHADRINSLSLDNIVEDDSSRHRNASDLLHSTSNIIDSRVEVGAFPLERCPMERFLEARIHAKSHAAAVVESSSSSRIEPCLKISKTNESGAGSSTPGVIHYNAFESNLTNLYEKKRGIQEKKETDEPARQPKLASDVKAELCEIRNSGNCDDIIGVLRLHSNSLAPSTILFAFECIREMLTENFKASSDKPRLLFRNKEVSWTKLFTSLMDTHFSNNTIRTKALETLWSVASYSSRHAQDINANDEIMKLIINIMETQTELVNEYGSGLIGCLAVSENNALSILKHCDGCLVQRLMSTSLTSKSTGTSHLNAIRALLRLSTVYHHHHQGFFGNLMGRHLTDDKIGDCPSAKAIGAVLDTLHEHPNELPLQTEGSRLLCQLFTRDAIIDDGVFFLVIDGVLRHIESMSSLESRSSGLDEAVLYLLSNISTYACDTIEDFLSLVLEVMAVSDSSSSALHGCRFIYNLCTSNAGERARFAIGDSGGINIILKLMSTFKGDTEVVGEACGAIFAICFESPSNKKHLVELGGVKSVYLSIDESSLEDDESLSLNIRACAGKNWT